MSTIRRFRNAPMRRFSTGPDFATGGRRNNRLFVYLIAYLLGALAGFGLIRLVHSPDWLSAVALLIPVVSGAIASPVQKKFDTISAPLWRIMVAIAAGIATVMLLTLALYWRAQHADIDARRYITASGNTGMGPGQSALFKVEVPSHRNYLTIRFAGTPSPGDIENCINGASLVLVQNYGATASRSSTIGFGRNYEAEIPPDVTRFTLFATFVPQSGFEVCASDVTVTSAHFHN